MTVHRETIPRWVARIFIAILCAAAARSSTVRAEEREPVETESVKEQRAQRLIDMRTKAEQFTITPGKSSDRKRLELRSEPIFRYSDQPRGFLDATLWAWKSEGGRGRPVAIAKAEIAIGETKTPYWQFCVASLADEPITVDFSNVRRLSAAKSGFELRPIPSAPNPVDQPAGRQRQMKNLVARFGATIDAKHLGKNELVKQEMRLLTSPIHHYADEATGLQDGMIFGFTTNGTNPDILVVIELRGTEFGTAVWKYGIVKMTDADVHVRLDRDEVWVSLQAERRETWNYFQENRRDK